MGGADGTDAGDEAPDIALTRAQFHSREGTTLVAGGDITLTAAELTIAGKTSIAAGGDETALMAITGSVRALFYW